MIYTFRYSELRCLKKMFNMKQLHHVKTSLFASPFMKNKLLDSDIVDKKDDNYVLTSLYDDLFYEWTHMYCSITFHDQGRYDMEDHTIMINPKKLITLEENVNGILVGYYFYDEVGIRNYILAKMNVNFESKVADDLKFRIVLTKDKYKAFMKMDPHILEMLTKQYCVSKDALMNYIKTMENKKELKRATYKNYKHFGTTYIKVKPGRHGNYVCKRIVTKNTEQYVVSICDGNQVPNEIFQENTRF